MREAIGNSSGIEPELRLQPTSPSDGTFDPLLGLNPEEKTFPHSEFRIPNSAFKRRGDKGIPTSGFRVLLPFEGRSGEWKS